MHGLIRVLKAPKDFSQYPDLISGYALNNVLNGATTDRLAVRAMLSAWRYMGEGCELCTVSHAFVISMVGDVVADSEVHVIRQS